MEIKPNVRWPFQTVVAICTLLRSSRPLAVAPSFDRLRTLPSVWPLRSPALNYARISKVSPAFFGMQGEFTARLVKKASLRPARNSEENLG